MAKKEINIGKIIQEISPINNKIRLSEGVEKILLMWDAGDILIKNNVKKVHPVAWKIQKSSYITRDLLSYCFRIRRFYNSKAEIEKKFSKIKYYTLFREAFPLLENPPEKIRPDDLVSLNKLVLSSDLKSKDEILAMKKRILKKSNDRKARIVEATPFFESYSRFNNLFENIKSKRDIQEIESLSLILGSDGCTYLSQLCSCLSVEQNVIPEKHIESAWPNEIKEFVIEFYKNLNTKESRQRFRNLLKQKGIQLTEIVYLAGFIYSIRDKNSIDKYLQVK